MLAGVRGIMEYGWDSGAHQAGGTVRLIQVAQKAHDLQRAAEFYSQLLGVQPAAIYDPPGLLFFDLKGVRLLLERGAPSSVLLFGGGGRPDEHQRPAGTDEWMAFIRDSEGNTVGLVSRHAPAVMRGMAPD